MFCLNGYNIISCFSEGLSPTAVNTRLFVCFILTSSDSNIQNTVLGGFCLKLEHSLFAFFFKVFKEKCEDVSPHSK